MKHGEDVRLGLRWIRGRPVESLLLIFGISLGIGATAAGVALAGKTGAEARRVLASTEYREVVVTAREQADEMDLPAVARTTTENVVLTTAELDARSVAPDVQYAYAANPRGLRFGSFEFGGPAALAAPPESGASGATEAKVELNASDGAGGASPAEGAPAEGAPPEGGPPDGPFDWQEEEPEAPEGPQPVIEEARAWEVTPEFFTANGMHVAEGSLFTDQDIQRDEPLLVLGANLAVTLFEDGLSMGRQVLAFRQLYRIVGILEPTGTDYDYAAFTPADMPELAGLGGVTRRFMAFNTSLHFTVADYTRLEEARAQLDTYFANAYGEGAVVITIPRYEAEAARDRSSRLVTVILFLALSALIISAANVTNILYSRTLRKRRAVGVLKALGATRRDVFQLFFLEAVLLGMGGAVVGAGLSVLLSKLMQDTMGFGAIYVSLLAVGIVGATALVTALDIFPALQASRTPASEAIRYE
jgi:hypothetical protein